MLLYPVHKQNSGFTLFEITLVTIIIGIVAAISAPNFFSFLKRNQVAEALSLIEGALREGQKQAERDGNICTLNIDTTGDLVSGGCLLETRTLGNNVQLHSNVTSVNFSSKGTASAGLTPIVIVVDLDNETNTKKCLIINSLGIIKTGDFTDDPTDSSALISDNCSA